MRGHNNATKKIFETEILDGTVYSFVGVDLQTHKCYDALSIMIHGYGGGYGQQTQIRSLLSIEDVRAYAEILLETHPERHYLERYLSITEEDIVELCKK